MTDTQADIKKQTINACWPIALAMATQFRVQHGSGYGQSSAKHFGTEHWDGKTYQVADFAEPGTIEYRLSPWADVRVVNLDIANVTPENVHVGPIEPVGEQRLINSRVMSSPNETGDDIDWEFKYRDLTSESVASAVAKEVGASVTAGLRQSVGYGSEMYGIQGETELSLQIEASVKAAWENTMASHREMEIESTRQIIQRAFTKTILERVEQIGPARQVITAKGELKFGFRLHSRGHFVKTWKTTPALLAEAKGIEVNPDLIDYHGYDTTWGWFYRQYPTPDALLDPIKVPVFSTIEKVREFENNTSVDLRVFREALNDEARLQEAIRLVAEQCENAGLKEMAEAEVKSWEDDDEQE